MAESTFLPKAAQCETYIFRTQSLISWRARFWLRANVGIASERFVTPRIFASRAAVGLAIAMTLSSTFLFVQASVAGTSSSGWKVPVLVESSTDWAMYPRISMAASGDAMAVWTQRSPPPDPFNRPGDGDVWASRYEPGLGWFPAESFGFVPGNAPDPRVAIDARGNAVAVWTEVEGVAPAQPSGRIAMSSARDGRGCTCWLTQTPAPRT